MLVAELDAVVHVVGDGLHPLPAGRHRAEQIPRGLAQLIGLAIAAAEQEQERVVGQPLDGNLGSLRHHRLQQAAVGNGAVKTQGNFARRRQEPSALVAERVGVGRGGDSRHAAERRLGLHVGAALGVYIEQADDWCRLGDGDGDLVSVVDQHWGPAGETQ